MTQVGSVTEPITTIEGLAQQERHPVLAASEDLDVPQCGYCQAGRSCRLRRCSSARRIPPTQRLMRP